MRFVIFSFLQDQQGRILSVHTTEQAANKAYAERCERVKNACLFSLVGRYNGDQPPEPNQLITFEAVRGRDPLITCRSDYV